MKEAVLYEKNADKSVHCYLCAHNCHISDGKYGFCKVRQNVEGVLYTHSYGKVIAQQIDPIEKKPLYHFLPGTKSFSIATKGCNFTCGFCQNWQISQTAKSDSSEKETSADYIVKRAVESGCKSISCTYTEPTIYLEYALDVCRIAKQKGLSTVFVTNGFMTEQALNLIKPYLDACNIDLKSFNENFYKKICSGNLSAVLQTISNVKNAGIWLEITTLIIPDENDSNEELKSIADFIASLDKDIPWHISRFFPQYEFFNKKSTDIEILYRAKEIAKTAGLRYVYLGNIPERTDTFCFNCQNVLIQRDGYEVRNLNLNHGRCVNCDSIISGRWE